MTKLGIILNFLYFQLVIFLCSAEVNLIVSSVGISVYVDKHTISVYFGKQKPHKGG